MPRWRGTAATYATDWSLDTTVTRNNRNRPVSSNIEVGADESWPCRQRRIHVDAHASVEPGSANLALLGVWARSLLRRTGPLQPRVGRLHQRPTEFCWTARSSRAECSTQTL